MSKKLTKELQEQFIDEVWERRFKGFENMPWYMSKEKFEELSMLINLDNGVLEIPAGMTEIPYGPFNRSLIKKIILPDTVTTIADEAFSGCDGLKEIVIPESVTSIGDNAFKGCDSLESIRIPETVKHIGDYAFAYCDNLKEVSIAYGVESIGAGAFSYCSSLIRVRIPDSVKHLGRRLFDGDYAMQSIELPAEFGRTDESITGHAELSKVFYY